jgi:hypothetical protein
MVVERATYCTTSNQLGGDSSGWMSAANLVKGDAPYSYIFMMPMHNQEGLSSSDSIACHVFFWILWFSIVPLMARYP